jgi:hypothetical protein
MSSIESNLEGFSMDINSDDILPPSTISKSRSKRKSRNIASPDHSNEIDITFSHIDHESDVGTCDEIPLDQIILQESLLSQESHNIHLTNDQLDSFDSVSGSEHGCLSVSSPLVEMLRTPVMKIEEDAEN